MYHYLYFKQLVALENIVITKKITTQVSKANHGWKKKVIQFKYMVAHKILPFGVNLIISLHNFIMFLCDKNFNNLTRLSFIKGTKFSIHC